MPLLYRSRYKPFVKTFLKRNLSLKKMFIGVPRIKALIFQWFEFHKKTLFCNKVSPDCILIKKLYIKGTGLGFHKDSLETLAKSYANFNNIFAKKLQNKKFLENLNKSQQEKKNLMVFFLQITFYIACILMVLCMKYFP